MRKRLFFGGVIISLVTGCRTPDPLAACRTIANITTPNSCYQTGEGLALTADTSPTAHITWAIVLFTDTLIQGGKSNTARYGTTTTTNTLTVPDSLARQFPKIGVTVIENGCDRTNTASLYFSFVKRPQQGSACVVWQQQEKFVLGD